MGCPPVSSEFRPALGVHGELVTRALPGEETQGGSPTWRTRAGEGGDRWPAGPHWESGGSAPALGGCCREVGRTPPAAPGTTEHEHGRALSSVPRAGRYISQPSVRVATDGKYRCPGFPRRSSASPEGGALCGQRGRRGYRHILTEREAERTDPLREALGASSVSTSR